MIKLYMIRHGQSMGNKEKKFLGHIDIGLSETGRHQAELAGGYMAKKQIDVIYSSDLLRAVQTAEPTAAAAGLEIIKSEALREVYAGEWEGKSFDYLTHNSDYAVWLKDIGNAVCTGGEAVREMADRTYDEILNIINKNPYAKGICIVTHATPIRALKCRILYNDFNKMKDIPWPSNASVTEIEYENGEMHIVKDAYDGYLGKEATYFGANV